MPQINRNALDAFRAFSPTQEHGAKALDNKEKLNTVDNDVSVIKFFDKDRAGNAIPFLNADPSPVTDPAKKDKILEPTAAQVKGFKGKPEAFAAFLTEAVAAQKAYLSPTRAQLETPTNYKFNAVVGQRVDQFRAEALKLAQDNFGGNREQLNKALYAVNTKAFDLYSRELKFDDFETNGYASYGNDAAFIHAWELRLGELNKIDTDLLTPDQKEAVSMEKSQLQGELDAIFRSKYVFNNSNLYENNAEKSVGLALIDKGSRQRASEVEATRNTIVPEFEILNLQHEGENKAVYFDAKRDKHYFDKSSQEVPADQIANIQRRPVDNRDLTFRRTEGGEHLREDFRFDWDGNGHVANTKIDWASWAGHCNDKAILEAHGCVVPRGHDGVYEYDSRSGSTAHYNRDLLNEKLLSFSELGEGMKGRRGRFNVGNEATVFAGARDDDRPDKLVLGDRQGTTLPFSDRPNKFTISDIEVGGKAYEADDAFRKYLVADDERSAENNPLFKGMTEGDRVNLKLGGAKITAKAKFQVFDENTGYPTMKSKDVVLDFGNPKDEAIVLDSVMQSAADREFYEISINPKTKVWSAQLYQMKEKEGGGFDKVKKDDPINRTIRPQDLVGQRETSLDNPAEYMPFVKEALQKAQNFTSETADGAGVWNGRTKSLEQAVVWRDDDTKWAKVDINVDARYGGNEGAFLVKLKDSGEPDFYVPLKMPFDFAWRTDVAFAPATKDGVNENALERGIVTKVGRSYQSPAISNMMEILHCAFNDRTYVINHEGQRFFFENKAEWEAAKAELNQLREAIKGGGNEPGPGPIANGVLHSIQNAKIGEGELNQFQVVAQADGDITLALNTLKGDSDLYVSTDGPATPDNYSHRSWHGGLDEDKIVLKDVKKGQVLNVAVHGYQASDFGVEVKGPKVGEQPAPEPQAINEHLAGVLNRGEWLNAENFPIEIQADGKLDLTMMGSGDADVFVGINREPDRTRGNHDFRLNKGTSNERGTLDVKAGDKVFVRVYGYGQRSEFDLNIKSIQD